MSLRVRENKIFPLESSIPNTTGHSVGDATDVLMRAIFPGDSEMADRMRQFDWAGSNFGPVEDWPEHLRIAVRLCLTSRFPTLLWWGTELSLLYNDAYLPWLSRTKHPRALGRPGYECWGEVWDIFGPMLEGVLCSGQATWSEDVELFYDRKIHKEEVYITWTFAPILAADGKTVDGIFCPCFETTEKVIDARRLETLRKLGSRAGEGRTVQAACREAAAVLSENNRDIPFAAIYVTNEIGDAAEQCAAMLPEGEHLLPLSIPASEAHGSSPWPLPSVLQTRQPAECADLDALGVRLPSGPWHEATRQALVLPIHRVNDQLAGLLVVGVSSRRPLDAEYRTFFDLVAVHIGKAISDANAYQAAQKPAEALAELDRAKTAEEALRGSDERFRLLVEDVADYAIIMLDPSGRVISWNDGAERIKGYREEEIIAEHFSRFYPADDVTAGKPQQLLELAAASGRVEHEGWRLRKDGTRFWADTVITAIRDKEGDLIGFSKITRDLTNRRRIEEERRRSATYLAEAQKLSRTGSWAWNVSTGELYWSVEHYRICGVDAENFTPTIESGLKFIHPDDLPSLQQALERALRERSNFECNLRIVRPDGTIRYVESLAHPVFNEAGELIEYVGTIIDRTEQHETRTALEQAFEEIKTLKDRLYHENVALREEIDRTAMFEEIVGTSRAVRVVSSRIAKVAPTDSTVLITGESGTGKELIARAIHKRSNRAGKPFVAFNCAGIPSTLIASELFGYEKGAFTGAQQRRLGRFELAEGGTIFLDEVGDLPAETQIALLRVLQEREFERVGGIQAIATDVRVLAASNRDLEDAIAAGAFRLDLFHRLNVFPIEVPALRERKEDIPLLMDYFIKRYAAKAGKGIKSVDKKSTQLFKSYSWPGNIRELQNVIERSVILCESQIFSVDESWLTKASLQPQRLSSTLAASLIEHEKKIIQTALAESRGRVSGRLGAAAKLGVPSSTLESKIKLLKIKKSSFTPEY